MESIFVGYSSCSRTDDELTPWWSVDVGGLARVYAVSIVRRSDSARKSEYDRPYIHWMYCLMAKILNNVNKHLNDNRPNIKMSETVGLS